ncbi:hypothetical protein CYLTODRAFT_487175 [Cylindrobasidium torrendii FP15055 ss-10]|uniref:T6SS Phospholipase effector Tle1-like catalytic domain-containing protein n=1 Tax=Cylindrobasidium torrendii FP15055 ss-10 TaxID=1314674 RepID=A0A0D7BM78_9AGAR|nr:hypothetical protein CYLTODRAFT_487175 [Cylindrobasidium torrendii FP15055 ss-10]
MACAGHAKLQIQQYIPPDNWQQVPFAYKLYTEVDKAGWEQSTDFKHSFCVEVDIEFVGVWDTVDSVGIIPRRLPFTTSNTLVRTFRHAVALDERRAKFKANLWNMPTEEEQQLGTPRASPSNSRKSSRQFNSIRSRKAPFPLDIKLDPEEEEFLNKMEARFSEEAPKPTDVREVWFSGCHCDVGGGSVKNSTRNSLARISLRWMVRECFLARTGIMFDTERLRDIGLEPTTLSPFVTPRPPPLSTKGKSIISPEPEFKKSFTQKVADGVKGMFTRPDMSASMASSVMSASVDPFISEEEEELRDALQPKYDQLKHAKFWYLLEVIPMEFRRQIGDGSTESRFGINLCRPREVPHSSDKPVEIHRSVKMRMEAMHATGNKKGKEYVPKAFRTGWPKNIKWVD